MHLHLPVLIELFAVLAVVSLAAPRLKVPPPVLLAVAGTLVALVPGLPPVRLDPDLVLFLFLPPILYADAFDTSWTDFRRWLRPIVMLAVGLVAFTIVVVGFVAHHFLPDLPLAACFVLGAIVSPTDTVAVQAVIERLRVPRRMTAILGGESLVNDATGLVGVQLGVALLATHGAFSAGATCFQFLRVAGLGIGVGVALGVLFALVNRVVRDVQVLFLISILSPYIAFLMADSLGASGVLAVVVAGFIVSWRIHHVPAAARVELYTVWDLIVFVLNGLCFVLIGFETPNLVREIAAGERLPLVVAGMVVGGAVIVARIAWCFFGAYLPFVFPESQRAREGGYPPWRNVLVVSWCGVRGVVSLAAALSLPMTLNDGAPFAGRTAILACTLCVILLTLIVQGLTLQPLIQLLGIPSDEASDKEVRHARETLLAAGIDRLDAFCSEKSCPVAVHHFRMLMADELASLKDGDEEAREQARVRLNVSQDVRRAVAAAQEVALLALRDRGILNDKAYLDLQLELDRRHGDHGGTAAA